MCVCVYVYVYVYVCIYLYIYVFIYIYFTFIYSHLADTFIQSDINNKSFQPIAKELFTLSRF